MNQNQLIGKCELNPSPIRFTKNDLIIGIGLVTAGILALFALKRRKNFYPKMWQRQPDKHIFALVPPKAQNNLKRRRYEGHVPKYSNRCISMPVHLFASHDSL